MSSIPHTPTSTTKRHRKPLSPARVYQVWAADVSQYGRRGAFRRTAELVGCSPEYIRQLVAKHEAEHAPKPEVFTAHELDYMPAPGEIPLRSPAPPELTASKAATPSTPAACDDYVKQDTNLNVNSCESGDESQTTTDKQPQATERENTSLPAGDLPTVAPQTISITADYVSRRDTTQPARRGLDLEQLGDALMFMVGPVPVVAWIVFGLVVLLLAGR